MFEKIKETRDILMPKDGCNCHKRSPYVDVNQLEQSNYGYSDLVPDKVNPQHYKMGKIEVIDYILDQKLDYLLGNVIKYISRAPYKGEEIEDLKKAAWYLAKKIETLEARRLET